MLEPSKSKIYLVGGGMSAMSAAVFLIRDAGVPGGNIQVFEQMPVAGGSLDGVAAPTPRRGWVSRGVGRFSARQDMCLWDLLSGIPSLDEPGRSVHEEIREFSEAYPEQAAPRVLRRAHAVADAAPLAPDPRDSADLVRLMGQSELAIGARRIDDFVRPEFFESDFWCAWRGMFGFQPWHAAVELKRHLDWHTPEFGGDAGVLRSPYDVYDSVVAPMQSWLRDRGVAFDFNVTVEDIDFAANMSGRYATKMYLTRSDGSPRSIVVEPEDAVFVTVGCTTGDCGYGDDATAARLVGNQRDGSWRLWEALARKAPDFGRPMTFGGDIAATARQSCTVTLDDRALLDRIEARTGAHAGAGGLTVFPDSAWLLTLDVPVQPHFRRRRPGAWCQGLRDGVAGDFVGKPMGDCTGAEILDELLGHLSCADIAARVRESASVTTVRMPYAGSAFQPRTVADRPLVVPDHARNFAFLGQFVELPDGIAATAEYAVRGAMTAVYHHFPVERDMPVRHHEPDGPRHPWFARRTVPNR